jgi:tetratricopeptide (TPR) repeat protein
MEQGDYQNAITEIGRAIIFSEQGDVPEQDRLSMSYDLGLAYQGAGNNENALKEFKEVYSTDPQFRDIAAKIREVQQGGQVSMARLKDDIEKEISSKFLMEGERIQREEKTRKKGSPTRI